MQKTFRDEHKQRNKTDREEIHSSGQAEGCEERRRQSVCALEQDHAGSLVVAMGGSAAPANDHAC